VPRGDQAGAAVPTGAGEHAHVATAHISPEQMPGEPRQPPPRVLRHALERDPEIAHHEAIHLAHLLGREPRQAGRVSDGKTVGAPREGIVPRRALCLRPPRLELDAKAVRDPVHVAEVSHNLVRVDDGAVIEAFLAKQADVVLAHGRRSAREPHGVRAERAHARVESFESAGGDRLRQRGIAAFAGERLTVMDDSVVAVVRRRDRDCHRLALRTR